MLRRVVLCSALVSLAVPRLAFASNGNKPRASATWNGAECATVVDRSTTPVVHFDYGVSMEETAPLSMDEPTDSRTMQFFGFSRLDYAAYSSTTRLPNWIQQDDIDRAALVDPINVVPATISSDEVLETTSRFTSSEWTRITADDARVPISNPQAAMGFDWDVSAVTPGGYTVWAYTWEPAFNKWTLRPGFVKVVATLADADAAGPVIALLDEGEITLTTGEAHPVPGCVDVPAGAKVTLDWGLVEGTVEPDWQPAIEDEPVETGMLSLDLILPGEAAEDSALIKLRATVTDSTGKSYVAYSPGSYFVMAGENGSDSGGDGGGGHGCCSVSGGELRGTASLLLFAGLFVRRRRRCVAPLQT